MHATGTPNFTQTYINAAGDIATATSVLATRSPLLGRLNLPHWQKVLLMGIFVFGFFTGGMANLS